MFCQHYDTEELDASVLLMPLLRFLPPDDERIRKTVLAIADELTDDGLVLRYRVDETDDGLSGEEGTFTICSFWLVSALVEIGELTRARALCEKLLSYASPLQLYAEEIDPRSGRHLGNFPQAFTHLALINAVMHVIRADEALEASAFDRELRRPRHSALGSWGGGRMSPQIRTWLSSALLQLAEHVAGFLEDVGPGEAAELVAATTGLPFALVVALPRVAGVVEGERVELDREAVPGPAAVHALGTGDLVGPRAAAGLPSRRRWRKRRSSLESVIFARRR